MSIQLTEDLAGCVIDAVNLDGDEVEIHFTNGLFLKVYMIDNVYEMASLEAVIEVYTKDKS